MKLSHRFLVTGAVWNLAAALISAEPQNKELAEARARYETALATAAQPVRDRYLKDLEQMKSRALGLKNLPLALEIEQEIKRIAPPPPLTEIRTAQDLERYLSDSEWSWGRTLESANSRLAFRRDGFCAVNNDAPLRWSAVDASTVKLENGTIFKFHSNRKAYSAETPAGPRTGKRL